MHGTYTHGLLNSSTFSNKKHANRNKLMSTETVHIIAHFNSLAPDRFRSGDFAGLRVHSPSAQWWTGQATDWPEGGRDCVQCRRASNSAP